MEAELLRIAEMQIALMESEKGLKGKKLQKFNELSARFNSLKKQS